ncbi:MAG: 3-hydroxyacyl-CoA dehydrogenase NAD-binding domain-containing protein [Pseudomonadota bacterium]|nr:3-hydroxyacyl-CoA dehydrogenase NAD-binding domain-containing protein [Pseudomonadota bacterium]
MSIETVGVIGAGVMGGGVAQSLAQTGHRVILVDILDAVLERARGAIRDGVRLQGLFKKAAADPDAVLHRIAFTTDYGRLQDADFVVENVVEKWEVKRQVYAQLDEVCPQRCVLAANTSALSITRIASATRRADRVIGMHFMNPVPLKPAVEVIRGYHTSEATLEAARALLAAMGKDGIVVNDAPGFVSNRVLMLTINEAIFLVHEQVAPAAEVDRIFRTCFGHKMGPLETADLIGLDTILHSIEVLYESFNDGKYRPCPLLKKLVDAGLHGRKTGQGFYSYQV